MQLQLCGTTSSQGRQAQHTAGSAITAQAVSAVFKTCRRPGGVKAMTSANAAVAPQHLLVYEQGLVLLLACTFDVVAACACACRYGVLFATIISWIPGSSVSYLTAAQPGGEARFEYFRQVRGCCSGCGLRCVNLRSNLGWQVAAQICHRTQKEKAHNECVNVRAANMRLAVLRHLKPA
jgi:hypothetical protein